MAPTEPESSDRRPGVSEPLPADAGPDDARWWSRFRASMREAFAVDDPTAFEPSAREAELAERICRKIVERRMSAPAEIFLETVRPLNYVGAQLLHFFAPFAGALVQTPAWNEFAEFLERRGSIEYLLRRIEALDAEADAARRAPGADPNSAVRPELPASADDGSSESETVGRAATDDESSPGRDGPEPRHDEEMPPDHGGPSDHDPHVRG